MKRRCRISIVDGPRIPDEFMSYPDHRYTHHRITRSSMNPRIRTNCPPIHAAHNVSEQPKSPVGPAPTDPTLARSAPNNTRSFSHDPASTRTSYQPGDNLRDGPHRQSPRPGHPRRSGDGEPHPPAIAEQPKAPQPAGTVRLSDPGRLQGRPWSQGASRHFR